MVPRLSTRCLLRPADVTPSSDALEVVGTFNPGAIAMEEDVVLLARVAERPRERRPGYVGLPRWDAQAGPIVDWVREEEVEFLDPRVVRRRSDGLVRLTFVSHLRAYRCPQGTTVAEEIGRFVPANDWEQFGVEDPRITRIDGQIYVTYVAVSPHGAATALASTSDFRTYERHGIIFCPENKDVVLFPERIEGRYVALHRPNPATPFSIPEIWIADSEDMIRWGGHRPVWGGAGAWEADRIGGGAPPLRVEDGWLAIYHGSRRPAGPGQVGIYTAGALLLDARHPDKILRRTREPLFMPEADFEREGFVPNVVFPTAIVPKGERLLVYYGAADAAVGVVEFSLQDVLDALK